MKTRLLLNNVAENNFSQIKSSDLQKEKGITGQFETEKNTSQIIIKKYINFFSQMQHNRNFIFPVMINHDFN